MEEGWKGSGGGKGVEEGRGEERRLRWEMEEVGEEAKEEVKGQRRWRKEGRGVCVPTSSISSPSCSTPCRPTGPSACTY